MIVPGSMPSLCIQAISLMLRIMIGPVNVIIGMMVVRLIQESLEIKAFKIFGKINV